MFEAVSTLMIGFQFFAYLQDKHDLFLLKQGKQLFRSSISQHFQHLNTVYIKIFPPFIFAPLPSLSAVEFKTGKISMSQTIFFIHNFVWANSRRCETICK